MQPVDHHAVELDIVCDQQATIVGRLLIALGHIHRRLVLLTTD